MISPNHSRRRFLQASSGASLSALLSSCGTPLPLRGPTQLKRTHPDDIIVDSHCHIFNGHDIDVAAYGLALTRDKLGLAGYAFLREVVAAYLVSLREAAPCMLDELKLLHELVDKVRGTKLDSSKRKAIVDNALQTHFGMPAIREKDCPAEINYTHAAWSALFYKMGENRGKKLANHFREQMSQSENPDVRDAGGKKSVPMDISQIIARVNQESANLLVHFTNYRTVNAFELWMQNCQGPSKGNVNLFVAASLDMNSWLCANRKVHGNKELSSGFMGDRSYMSMQAELMSLIAQLFGGEILPMAGYCPRFAAEVTHGYFLNRGGKRPDHHFEDPLKTFAYAVEKQGHLGAKLYPPMGFRPYNNTELDHSFWSRGFGGMDAPDSKRAFPDGELGKHLDEELTRFYRYCAANDVPIMAHTGPSHGARIGYALRARPDYWEAVFNPQTADAPHNLGLAELRLNLSHLGCWQPNPSLRPVALVGDTDNVKWANMVMKMTAKHPHLYSDLADFEDVGKSESWRQKFADTYERWNKVEPTSKENAARRKIMFGSDWFLNAQSDVLLDDEKVRKTNPDKLDGLVSRPYTQRWSHYLDELEPRTKLKRADIMGHNALRFFGLNNAKSLSRVDSFLDEHCICPPEWRQRLGRRLKDGAI